MNRQRTSSLTKKRHHRNKKNSNRGKGTKKYNSRKDTKLTKKNWMKKLIFTGGNSAEHAEHVFGGIGQQHAISNSNNAIYQNPLPITAPIPDTTTTIPPEQTGGKKQKRKSKKH
jgi:hypothetical protein